MLPGRDNTHCIACKLYLKSYAPFQVPMLVGGKVVYIVGRPPNPRHVSRDYAYFRYLSMQLGVRRQDMSIIPAVLCEPSLVSPGIVARRQCRPMVLDYIPVVADRKVIAFGADAAKALTRDETLVFDDVLGTVMDVPCFGEVLVTYSIGELFRHTVNDGDYHHGYHQAIVSHARRFIANEPRQEFPPMTIVKEDAI